MDDKPETENQIHELNSEFIGPFVCARPLWVQSFISKQTMQRNLSKVLWIQSFGSMSHAASEGP